jgi:hypothetical protein
LSALPWSEALREDSPIEKPLRKLIAVWLANRGEEYSALRPGLKLALWHDIADSLSTARRVIGSRASHKKAKVWLEKPLK